MTTPPDPVPSLRRRAGVMTLDEARLNSLTVDDRRVDLIHSAARGQGPTFIAAKLDMLIAAVHAEATRAEREHIKHLRQALESIAANSCCDRCQEAALVARAALQGRVFLPAGTVVCSASGKPVTLQQDTSAIAGRARHE